MLDIHLPYIADFVQTMISRHQQEMLHLLERYGSGYHLTSSSTESLSDNVMMFSSASWRTSTLPGNGTVRECRWSERVRQCQSIYDFGGILSYGWWKSSCRQFVFHLVIQIRYLNSPCLAIHSKDGSMDAQKLSVQQAIATASRYSEQGGLCDIAIFCSPLF